MDVNLSQLHIIPTTSEEEERHAHALQELLAQTPKNDFGFPFGIYRPDMLPFHDYLPENAAVQTLFGLGDEQRLNGSDGRSLLTTQSTPNNRDLGEELDDGDEDDDDEEGLDELDFNDDDATETESELDTLGSGNAPVHPNLPVPRSATSGSSVPPQQAYNSGRIAGFRKSHLQAAFIPLTYEEGYPALPDGRPVWDRLPHEPSDSFTCFQAFLQLPLVCEGSRILGDLSHVMEANQILHVNGFEHSTFTAKFNTLQKTFYWSIRARAYDLYQTAAYRKRQELRALQTQDNHFTMSQGLLDKLMNYLNDDDLFWDQMTPKVAVDTLKTIVGIQRVSAGLPATTPTNAKSEGQGQTLEMILRTLSQSGAVQTEQATEADGGGAGLISRILGNPDDLRVAQELIIRLGRGSPNP